MSDDATSPLVVGQQLARRRNDLDLTQDGLAKRIGVSARTVSAIERGMNSIQRGNRATWESALRLKAGTISRAYRDGSPVEPDPTVPMDNAKLSVAELAERLERLEQTTARHRQENAELRKMLHEITGKDPQSAGNAGGEEPESDEPRQAM